MIPSNGACSPNSDFVVVGWSRNSLVVVVVVFVLLLMRFFFIVAVFSSQVGSLCHWAEVTAKTEGLQLHEFGIFQ